MITHDILVDLVSSAFWTHDNQSFELNSALILEVHQII